MAYNDFAFVYDALMGDADYPKRSRYILKLFKKFESVPTLLLDVACGTGNFSMEFAKTGFEVIGTDMSEDMLSVAREKSQEAGLDILYLCQKAEELDLYGTVDGAICCMDSINHITDKKVLSKALKKISLFLEKDKLFIFDVNTPYKHREILGNNTFVFEEEGVFCVWQNNYNKKRCETAIKLDFFCESENGYARSHEEFFERAYTEEEIKMMLKSADFKVEAVFDDMTFNEPKEQSERVFFVCRKI